MQSLTFLNSLVVAAANVIMAITPTSMAAGTAIPTSLELFRIVHQTATFAVNLGVQTSLVMLIGLTAARLIRSQGAALQSCVLRMTLVATLCCPGVSCVLSTAGVSGFRLELPFAQPSPDDANPVKADSPLTPSVTRQRGDESITTPRLDAVSPPVESSREMSSIGGDALLQWDKSIADSNPPGQSSNLPSATSSTKLREIVAESEVGPSRTQLRLPVGYLLICSIWMAATGFLLVRLVIAVLVMQRLRHRSSMAPAEVLDECRAIAQQMRVINPPVLVNDRLSSPCLMGWMRPAIMLPKDLQPVNPNVLAHELAHLRRHDCHWNLLGHLAITVVPWQPLVYLLNRRMEQAADNVCDDYVVAHNFDRVTYARELLSIAERFPAAWTNATTAVGIAEIQSSLGHRVQRILDASRTLSLRTGWKNLMLMFVAALLGTAIAGFLGAARTEIATKSNSPIVSEEPVPDENLLALAAPDEQQPVDEVIVTGVVLKPDGSPAAGATIRAAATVWTMLATVLPRGYVPKMNITTADADGKFSIAISTQPYGVLKDLDEQWMNLWKRTTVAATLPEFGPAWIEYKDIDVKAPLELHLVEDVPIRGRILDLEGQPIAGAKIKLSELRAAKDDDLSAWLAGIKAGEPPWTVVGKAPREPELRLIGIPDSVITDRDGVLNIQGLGKDRTIQLTFEGENMAHRSVTVVSRAMEPMKRVISQPPFAANEPVFGAEFEFPVPPSRPIEGIVVDSKTGLPLAGVSVETNKFADYPYSNWRVLKTSTDSAGRFRLLGMPKGSGNEILLVPNDDQPYFMRSVRVPNPAGIAPVEMKIKLHQGIWIRGRVTDKSTHEPVAGVRLHYFPFRTNEFARKTPEFDKDGNVDGDQGRYVTDREGKYRLVGLPGRAVVGAESVMKAYRPGVGFDKIDGPKDGDERLLTWSNPITPSRSWPSVMYEINPGQADEQVQLDFELDPGFSVRLRLLDGEKKPVTGAKITGLVNVIQSTDSQNSVAQIVNLAPDEHRMIIAIHPERNIGWATRLSPPYEGDREITMELVPCASISGRLLNDGDPIPGLTIEPRFAGKSWGYSEHLPTMTADLNGRFSGTLIPGAEYELLAQGKGMNKKGMENIIALVIDNLAVKPGEKKDLGDLNIGDDRKFHPVKTDDNKTGKADPIQNRDQSPEKRIAISGKVLRPDGSPAVGAMVRSTARVPQWAKGLPEGFLPEVREIKTDANGNFTFSMNTQPFGKGYHLHEGWSEFWRKYVVGASLDGFGGTWAEVGMKEDSSQVVLQLVEDSPVRGRVVNLEGTPLSGTRAKIGFVRRFVREADSEMRVAEDLDANTFRVIGIPNFLETDHNGWIELRGLGKDRLIEMTLADDRIAFQKVIVTNREIDPAKPRALPKPSRSDDPTQRLGSPFELSVSPCRPFEGIVVDASSGQPVSGVTIQCLKLANYLYGGVGDHQSLATKTGRDGRFRLVGMPKGNGNEITVIPTDDQPFFIREIDVPDSAGIDPIEMRIELHWGIWIKGRVTDHVTHEPVAYVHMMYLPFLTNEFAQKLPEFDNDGNINGAFVRRMTDRDGNYRIVGLPGRAVVGAESLVKPFRKGVGFKDVDGPRGQTNDLLTWRVVHAPSNSWPTSIHEINPGANQGEVQVDVELYPGVSLQLALIDQRKQPIEGAEIFGLGGATIMSTKTTQELINYGPDKAQFLIAYHKDREIGRVMKVPPQNDESREVVLECGPMATITGRLFDEDDPLPRVVISVGCETEFGNMQAYPNHSAFTDSEGRFRVKVLSGVAGTTYSLRLHQQRNIDFAVVCDKLLIEPGEVKDLGDLTLGKDRRFLTAKPMVKTSNAN